MTRFGTEGSEVQILSPRPISKKIREIQSAGSLGFPRSGFNVGTECPALQIQPRASNRPDILASVLPSRTPLSADSSEAKRYPRRYPTVVVGH